MIVPLGRPRNAAQETQLRTTTQREGMGNICSKASDPDTSSAGRRLGSGPPTAGATSTYGGAFNQTPTTSLPIVHKKPRTKPKVTGPGRTLGESVSSGGEDSVRDAREAAARAAEVGHTFVQFGYFCDAG